MAGFFSRIFGLGGSAEGESAAEAEAETFLGYEVVKKAAMAGPVTTYLGRDREKDAPVAIKVLDPGKRGDKDKGPRFQREAEVYGKLSHPHIVTFLAAGEEDGKPGIVLEWIAAPTLAAILKEEPRRFQPPQALQLYRQLLGALESAHAQGVVHRDVSPKNIHVVDGKHLKLTNFSVAKASDPRLSTRVGTHFGDYRYSSPEQNKAQETDATTDLYSAGLILYELLTGQKALSGNGLVEVLGQQMREEFVAASRMRPGVPEAVDGYLARLLAFDAKRRPGSAEAARARLDDLGL